MPSIIALIPARGGSKRIARKNTRLFCGRPLLAWTVAAAQASGIFDRVYVSTEDQVTAQIVGNTMPGVAVIDRPPEYATDLSPDIEWVSHALRWMDNGYVRPYYPPDAFAILRPTSPFRTGDTIRAAWEHFQQYPEADSLRAVEPARQHPYKMWRQRADGLIEPWQWEIDDDTPCHSLPTQALPPVLAQNASLEMAWSRVVLDAKIPTISGSKVLPWTMEGHEGMDLNTPDDWEYAEYLVNQGLARLPGVG